MGKSFDELQRLFDTTLQRYLVQMAILSDLEKQVVNDGVTVTKEYVKGRRNVYENPCISSYNKTAVAANGTIVTMLKILAMMSGTNKESLPSPLQRIQDKIEYG